MLNSPIIDIAIGLALVYLLLSLIVTAVTGYVAQLMSLRAKKLEKGMKNMLGQLKDGTDVTELLYDAPLIKPSVDPDGVKGKKPNWIDTSMFVPALIQGLKKADKVKAEFNEEVDDIEKLIKLTDGSPIGENIASLYQRAKREVGDSVDDATQTYVRFEQNLEQWFDSSMEDVSDWYSGHVKWITFFIAIFVAAAFNADSIRIAETIYDGKVKLPAMTKFAEEYAEVAANSARKQQNWQAIYGNSQQSGENPGPQPSDAASTEPMFLESGYYTVYDQAEQREAIQSEVEVLLGGLHASDIPIGWDGSDLQAFKGWIGNTKTWFGAAVETDQNQGEKLTLVLEVFTEIIEAKKSKIYAQKVEAQERLKRIQAGKQSKSYDSASPQMVGQVAGNFLKLVELVGENGNGGEIARVESLLFDAETQLEESRAMIENGVDEEKTRESFKKLLKLAYLDKLSESERYELGEEAIERVRRDPKYDNRSAESLEKEIEFLLIDAKSKYPELVELGRRYFLPQYFKWSLLLQMLLGWLVTAFALTLGAPFWFGMLKKLVKIRENQKTQRSTPTAA